MHNESKKALQCCDDAADAEVKPRDQIAILWEVWSPGVTLFKGMKIKNDDLETFQAYREI